MATGNELDTAPVSLRKAFDGVSVDDILQETRASLHRAESGDGRFPEGHRRGGPLWTRDLIGYPFLICSDPIFRTEPAKKLEDGRSFGPREVAQLWVAQVDTVGGTIGEAQLATLHGAYMLNQLRALVGQLVVKKLWTVARNPKMPANEQYGHPCMLATWDPAQDNPEAYGFPGEVTGSVADRIAEIAAAGGPVPPEELPRTRGAKPTAKP